MRRAWTWCVAGVFVLGAAAAAHAYELLRVTGNPCDRQAQNLFWASHHAVIDPAFLQPSQFQGYAIDAEAQWNAAIGTFQFQVGSARGFCNGTDGVTSMGFSNTVCDGSQYGDTVSITYFHYNSSTGEFADADVTFRADSAPLTGQALFTQIAMHELGHVLGLAHSDACGGNGAGTLMQAVTSLSAPRLTAPQSDDIAGAVAIYGGGSTGGGGGPAMNHCAIVAGGPHRPAFEMLILPLLVFALRRRSRRTEPNRRRS